MDVATLKRAMHETHVSDATLAAYLPHFEEAMRAARITTVRRAAAWCSQIGHESGGLRYMAEIATSGPGWNWDRTRYRGRGPIQLTWQGNYHKFGQWCQAQGYVDDPELFVNQPELVEEPRWGFLAASWYWLHGGPRPGQINGFADAGDILAVSRCVNGWRDEPNGMPDRRARWERCLAIGDALLTDQPAGGSMAVSGDPIWLEDVLRPALGDRLIVEPGWKERGVGGVMGVIWGTMIHHTGNVNETVKNIRDGVQQPTGWLPGPLSQGLILPNGKFHLIAVGPCNHAGGGNWKDLTDGNRQSIGLECAYSGSGRWPDAQVITMRDASAAISRHLGKRASDSVCGHKEYAKPAGRKPDPGNMDMEWFRGEVQKDLDGFIFPGEGGGTVPAPPVIVPGPVHFLDNLRDKSDRQLLVEMWHQLRGLDGLGWPQLGDKTIVDALAEQKAETAKISAMLAELQKRGNA